MALLGTIYNEIKETYGGDVAINAVCVCGSIICLGGCIGLASLAALLRPKQPIIIVNQPIQK